MVETRHCFKGFLLGIVVHSPPTPKSSRFDVFILSSSVKSSLSCTNSKVANQHVRRYATSLMLLCDSVL